MNENTNDKYIGTLLDGRYEILEVIGEGGMAVVYKAMCNRLNRYVAVKIMRDEMAADEEFKRRFCAESQAVAMLSHSNIVAVYDVSQNDNLEYIVMELVEGITLKQYLEKKGPVGWRETLHFSKQIARALAHAHERGIIHRDIKPQNIMLLRDGTIKVGDFGIAALENEVGDMNGQAIGSIHYIAPEQARGELPDARSDIYSLGVVMYEMLTGSLPYNGDSLSEIAFKHIEANPVLPHELVSDFPPELETIILKAMNPDVSERYQSANELLEALDSFTGSQVEEEQTIQDETVEVEPVRSSSEISKSLFRLRRKRSEKVGFFSGTFFALLMAVCLFVFLWKFWLQDLFSNTVSVELPDFTGKSIDSVISDSEYSATFNFNVSYVSVGDCEPGMIVAQDPVGGRKVALTNDGVEVRLSVYSGNQFSVVPDLVNEDYRTAETTLSSMGLIVEITNDVSDTIEKDKVISTSPSAGESIASGSVVYVTVSSGSSVSFVQVPNLIGLTEDAAIVKINGSNLSYGGTNYIPHSAEPGIVVAQSIAAFSETEEHAKITITVSAGLG